MKYQIDHYINLAEMKKITFLGYLPENTKSKTKWKCNKGHIYEASYSSVKDNNCPYCSKKIKHTLDEVKERFKKSGIIITSDRYVSAQTPIKGICTYCNTEKMFKPADYFCHQYRKCVCTRFESICNSNMSKYGVKNINQCEIGKDKRRQTNIIKYGYPCALQNRIVALKRAKSENNHYLVNHWKNNEELVAVGSYEYKTLLWLNNNKIDYDWQIVFPYKENKIYRVDLYLKDEDKYVEIKGYFRDDAKEKWEWFNRTYPNSELWMVKQLKDKGIL